MARKVNIRGGKVLVLGGVVPVTEERCCCPCPILCIRADLTLHAAPNTEYLTTGLLLSASDTCTAPPDPAQERCVYTGAAACLAGHTAVLTRYCDDDWVLVIDGTASTPRNAVLPYGAYTFPAGSNIGATLSACADDTWPAPLIYCVQLWAGMSCSTLFKSGAAACRAICVGSQWDRYYFGTCRQVSTSPAYYNLWTVKSDSGGVPIGYETGAACSAAGCT